MTGLWQVSGRSGLSWEEAEQLDIDYAHNWSLLGDLLILARTLTRRACGGGRALMMASHIARSGLVTLEPLHRVSGPHARRLGCTCSLFVRQLLPERGLRC